LRYAVKKGAIMGLAYIGKVFQTRPIEGADRIHSVQVVCGKGGIWNGVASKDVTEGNLVEVYLQDAILPTGERFDFMDKYHRRVSMKRFKGAPSDCLIMPLADSTADLITSIPPWIGFDLTDLLEVKKYEKEVIYGQGEIMGGFTTLLPKTDEPNFQSVPDIVRETLALPWRATLKYDGTSCTILKTDEGELQVFSRNMRIREGANNYWRIVDKYGLKDAILPGEAFQMEIVGPGIQKNPLGLKEIDAFVFNAFWEWKPKHYARNFEKILIPAAEEVHRFGPRDVPSNEELWKLAEVRYKNGAIAEGIVIRPQHADFPRSSMGERLSFKVINLLYGK
jgi:RNA ligase (TIGR02306 family)